MNEEFPNWVNKTLEKKYTFQNPHFIDEAFKEAQEAKKIDTIKMEDFRDLYHDTVDEDRKYVEDKEKNFAEKNTPQEKENKKIATILEGILHQHIEQSNFLGDSVSTVSTCKYDDIKNGIDGILEVQNERNSTAEHLAFAIDATFSADIDKKINRIKKEIKNGELAKIKYFKSDFLDFRGEKGGIPKFVIGIDRNHVEEVTQIWMQDKKSELAKSPLQIVIFREIMSQAEDFEEYAQSVGKPKIARKYKEIQNILYKIEKEKKKEWDEILENSKNRKFIEDDEVFKAIDNLDLDSEK